MSELRLYVWEGEGISDAYHQDGTLVVLAESPEQAVEVVRQKEQALTDDENRWDQHLWDLKAERLDRPPDRVLTLDGPAFVAFNGGGYD